MRALVRTQGLLLIGVGAVLWLYAARIASLNHPVTTIAVAPVAKPVPRSIKSHRHIESAEPKAPTSLPEEQGPKLPPMSKVVLSYVNPEQHKFTIDLHRQDGWFDTGIPVTADIMVLEFCVGEGPPTGGWIQAMIGGNEILPRGDSPFHQQITLSTYLPGQDPDRTMADPTAQFLQMSGEAVQTLKLRIAGDNAPDEVRQVMIKIYVRPKDANQPQQFTAPQQREQTELAKWVKQ